MLSSLILPERSTGQHDLEIALEQIGPFLFQRGQDQFIDDDLARLVGEILLAALFRHHAIIVLRRQYHGVNAVRRAVGFIFDGDLALGVGPQPLDFALFPQLGVILHEAVGQINRQAA